jgi:bla regulator protein blaR1
MKSTITSVSLIILATGWMFAQSSTAPPKFEVASIKPSSGDDRRVAMLFQPGGGFRATGATLKMLLTLAYDVREFQISGGPNWINSDRFDITARPELSVGPETAANDPRAMSDSQRKTMQEQMAQRLQALFAERFQLAIHRETKEQQVYALLVGKNGPKVHETQDTSGPRQGMMRMSRGQVEGQGVSLDALVHALSNQLGRPMIDRTGLTGHFDIKLEWTPDPGQSATPLGGAPPPGVEAPPPPNPNGPSLFTAIQEQLGLRLESQRGPVEMIVIDRVEKPSEN